MVKRKTAASAKEPGQNRTRAARGVATRSAEPAAAVAPAPMTRAMGVLETAIAATRPMTSLELARRSGIDPSSSHRLVQNLTAAGYLVRDDTTKRYLPHPRLLFPLPLHHPWELVRRDASTVLLQLRDEVGLTAGLTMFYAGSRVLLELTQGRDPLSPDYSTVLTSPLHASGSGKVLLHSLPEPERRTLLGPEPYTGFTEQTLVTWDTLSRDLAEGASRGFFVARDDYISGFRVVAAPVTVMDAIVGCLFCSGGATALADGQIATIGESVRRAADLFSRATPTLRTLAPLLLDTES